MENSEFKRAGWWLLNSCVPTVVVAFVGFGFNGAPKPVVLFIYACTLYVVASFPLGVLCLVIDQFLRWFGKSPRH